MTDSKWTRKAEYWGQLALRANMNREYQLQGLSMAVAKNALRRQDYSEGGGRKVNRRYRELLRTLGLEPSRLSQLPEPLAELLCLAEGNDHVRYDWRSRTYTTKPWVAQALRAGKLFEARPKGRRHRPEWRERWLS